MASGSIQLGASVNSGTSPTGSAGGDLTGTYPNPTISPLAALSIVSIATSSATPFVWNGAAPSTAANVFGASGTGGSVLFNTPSLNANFSSGLAIDGSFVGTETIINLRALGVQSGGGYGSTLKIFTSLGADQVQVGQFASDKTFTSNGGVRIATADAKPSAAAGYRGLLFVVQGGTGVKDTLQICLKNADDTYSWVDIVSGAP